MNMPLTGMVYSLGNVWVADFIGDISQCGGDMLLTAAADASEL
jgi:hypothetical protein